MKYRLIAFDLDYTLLDSQGSVTEQTRAAVERAQRAGVLVVPCTGREWHTGKAVGLDHLPTLTLGVFKDGATVCEVATGRVLRSVVFTRELACQVLDRIGEAQVSMLLSRLADDGGCDYLIAGAEPVEGLEQSWSGYTAERLEQSWSGHAAERLSVTSRPSPDDLGAVLEIRLYARAAQPIEEAQRVLGQLDEPLVLRTWEPTALLEHHVLQVYSPGVDKWPALEWVAGQHDIAPAEIAMIGDHVNDVAAIRAAGCGVAMGNAVEEARAVADRVTRSCDNDGVAHAIEQLLAGRW